MTKDLANAENNTPIIDVEMASRHCQAAGNGYQILLTPVTQGYPVFVGTPYRALHGTRRLTRLRAMAAPLSEAALERNDLSTGV